MKLTRRNFLVSLLLIVTSLFCIYNFKHLGWTKKDKNHSYKSKSGYFLGTYINLKVYDDCSDKILNGAFKVIKDIEYKMSINIDSSEVSKINANSGKSEVKVSPETFEVIKKGIYYSNLSNGNFDITIGPLVKLWGIGSDNAKVPAPSEIKNAINKINYKDVILDEKNNTVKLKNKDMIIDLGGIAKGYVADKIVEYLKSKNIQSAMIDLGGNIYALGKNPTKESWSVGIQNPIESRGTPLGILNINNKSVVTSGIYERFFEKDGKKYHHILSPFTGYPIENSLLSTTIVSDKSVDCDALSTTLFTSGIEKGLQLVESIKNVDVILVTKNKEVYITSGLKNKFKIDNEEYKIVN